MASKVSESDPGLDKTQSQERSERSPPNKDSAMDAMKLALNKLSTTPIQLVTPATPTTDHVTVDVDGKKSDGKQKKKLYWTKTYAFKSICELLAYHKRNHKPIYADIVLICGLARHGWQLNNEQVALDKKLGEGQFGEVYKGTLKTSVFARPTTVAVKTLHHNHMSANEKILFLKEANVMLTLAHPNVIKFYGVCTMKEPIMIVMEFCDGRSLEDVLQSKEKVSLDDKILYLFDAACGIDYLHGKHVIHRDIAARNSLLTSKKVLKISDFGLSVKGVAIKERKGGCLPVKYMAPETLKKGLYSTSSDIYSYGALIYETFTDGKTPFEACGLKGNQLRKAIIGQTVKLTLDMEVPVYIALIFEQSRMYHTEERITSKGIIEVFKAESGLEELDTQGFFHRFINLAQKLRRRGENQENEVNIAPKSTELAQNLNYPIAAKV
uniref:non-specific protein-tyrosine kinase n=1 Tax=Caenorhabditis japonica TaxID=281687 RepID=A0A8R1E0H4_CAEJA